MSLRSLFLLVVMSVLVVGGCSETSEPEYEDLLVEPPRIPFAYTEDILMMNFLVAYEDMDFDRLKNLLHPDFATYLQERTKADFPERGATLDRAEELVIGVHMLGGDPFTNAEGDLISGIATMDFNMFQQLTPWREASSTNVISTGWTADYLISLLVDRGGEIPLKSEGMIRFFIARRDSLHYGRTQDYWEMTGQRDLTNTKGLAPVMWGTLKALYY